jgi:hypothetical protein
VRTKVKTPGTGEIMVEEAVQTSTWRGCANSIIPSPGSCLVPNNLVLRYFSHVHEGQSVFMLLSER